jgi:hypothetical protein
MSNIQTFEQIVKKKRGLASSLTTEVLNAARIMELRLRSCKAVSKLYSNVVTHDKCLMKYLVGVRGSRLYASSQYIKRKRDIEVLLENKERLLFVTVSPQFDLYNPKASWEKVNDGLGKVSRYLRLNKVKDYIRVIEANRFGGCHIHFILDMGKELDFIESKEKVKGGGYKCVKRLTGKDYLIGLKIEGIFNGRAYNGKSNVDIRGVCSDGLGDYMLKEVTKFTNVEKAVKYVKEGNYRKGGVFSEDDIHNQKVLLTHSMALKTKMRLYQTSKGLAARVKVKRLEEMVKVREEKQRVSSMKIKRMLDGLKEGVGGLKSVEDMCSVLSKNKSTSKCIERSGDVLYVLGKVQRLCNNSVMGGLNIEREGKDREKKGFGEEWECISTVEIPLSMHKEDWYTVKSGRIKEGIEYQELMKLHERNMWLNNIGCKES